MHRAVLSGLGRRWKKLKLLIIAEVVIAVRLSRAMGWGKPRRFSGRDQGLESRNEMEEHCVVEGLIGAWHGHRLHERDKVEARWAKGVRVSMPRYGSRNNR